jgi:carboxypeptidase Taq
MIWHRIQTKKQQQQQQQQQQEEEKKLNLEDTIASARFDLLKAWLKDNIHNFGATYSPQDLMKRTFGEGYNPEWLVRYLESKYLA